jgi:hypothetical protein
MNGVHRLDVRAELTPLLVGAGLVMVAVLITTRYGASAGLISVLGLALFAASTVAFLAVPHVAVAAAIPLFAVLPATKVLVSYGVGPLKEVVTLSAAAAALLSVLQKDGRRAFERTDRVLLVALAVYLGLYVLNVGGLYSESWHGDQWLHGVRLTAEPLLLLLVGLLLPTPRRTLRWAATSLVATGCVVAAYGIAQQVIGGAQLVSIGYAYNEQVRTIDGRLRSFGTLDDPFTYAAFLLLALATIVFGMRRGWLSAASAAVVTIGIAASSVLTAAVVVCALAAIWLVRVGRVMAGLLLACAVAGAAVVLVIAAASPTRSQTVEAGTNTYVTLNGRTSVWGSTFADTEKIPLGLGVGEVGRAAIRARIGVTDVSGSPGQSDQEGQLAVDSGYYATVADVGIVGLLVLMLMMIRVFVLARRGTRLAGNTAAWLCLGYLAVFALDAATRDSFTGYPNAYVGMLMVGITLAVLRDQEPLGQPRRLTH